MPAAHAADAGAARRRASRSAPSSPCAPAASRVEPGSIHALVGENGAGKSTLVKIVAGVYRRDAGDVPARRRGRRLPLDRRVQGRRRRRDLPGADALPRPVGHREHLHGPPAARARLGRIDRARDARRGRRGSSRGSACASTRDRPAAGLSIADQQIIEIAKAISLDARVLDHGRADRRAQRRRGRAAVRRRPQPARRGPRAGLHLAPLRRGLRPLRHRHRHARRRVRRHQRRSPTPRVDAARRARWSAARSATCSRRPPAEIGDAGPRGRGAALDRHLPRRHASRCAPARSSAWPAWSAPAAARSPARSSASTATTPGSVTARRQAACPRRNPRAAIRAGMAFVPEDRRKQGLVIETLGRPQRRRRDPRAAGQGGPAHRAAPRTAAAAPWAGRLEVKTSALDTDAATMSGGNQQKVVIAKWLATEPQLLIIDEPTRGIDVGTKAEVHRLLSELAGAGPGDPDDLLRAARGARHGRPRAGRLRGPDHRRHRPRRRHPRGRHARRHRTLEAAR